MPHPLRESRLALTLNLDVDQDQFVRSVYRGNLCNQSSETALALRDVGERLRVTEVDCGAVGLLLGSASMLGVI